MVVLVIGMKCSVDGAGGFFIVRGEIEMTYGVVGEAELVGLALKRDGMFAKGVGHIGTAGKKAFEPFRLDQIGREITDVDLCQIDMDIVPVALTGGVGRDSDGLIAAAEVEAIGGEILVLVSQLPVLIDVPDLAVDLEGGFDAGAHCLYADIEIGGVEGLAGAGRDLQAGEIAHRAEVDAGAGEMQAVVDEDLADAVRHAEAVEITAASYEDMVEGDVLITELRHIGVEVQEVLPGIDTAVDAGVVEAPEVFDEQVDVFIYIFGVDHEAEILVRGDGLRRRDIARIIFVQKGLEGGGEVMDRELADDGAVEFVADNGDGLVAVDDAGFEGQGVEGDALAVLEQRGIVDAGFTEE